MRILYIIFMPLFVIACGNKPTPKGVTGNRKEFVIIDSTILVNPLNSKAFNASEIVDKIEYIQLETNEESMIGRINKISLVNHKLFISDSEITFSLYCFNEAGDFIFKISQKGNGPGEYIDITDFVVTEKEIIIYDGRKQNFLYFDLSGKYSRTENLGLYFSSFTKINNGQLFLFSDQQVNPNLFSNPQYSCILMNRRYKLLDQYLSFDIESDLFQKTQIISNNISVREEGVFIYETCDEHIYLFSEQNLIRLYQLSFAAKHVNHEILKTSSLEELRVDYRPESTIWGLESFQVVSNWLIAQYFYNRQAQFLFYNRESGLTINSSRIVNDVDSMFVCMIPPFYSDGTRLMCVIDRYLLNIVHVKLREQSNMGIDVPQSSLDLNPIIQILTLK